MKYGTHNSCTYAPLFGWQKILAPFAWMFAWCQPKTLEEQYDSGVRLFDIQTARKNGKWYISHGAIWYDMTLDEVFARLNKLAYGNKEPVYIRLGLDNHWGTRTEEYDFYIQIEDIGKGFNHIIIDEVYIEKPWKIVKESSLNVTHKYWTTAWAKAKCNKWWKFYYHLPVPWLWAKLYKKEWIKESTNNDYLMTDFI